MPLITLDGTEGRDVVPHFLGLLARLILLFETPPPRFALYLDLLDVIAAERLWLAHNAGPWASVTDDDRSLVRQLTVALQVNLERMLEAAGHPDKDVDLAGVIALIQGYAVFVHHLAGSQGSLPVVPGAPVH